MTGKLETIRSRANREAFSASTMPMSFAAQYFRRAMKPGRLSTGSAPDTARIAELSDDLELHCLGVDRHRRALAALAVLVEAGVGSGAGAEIGDGGRLRHGNPNGFNA
jgi:hypothetical protein